MEPDLERYYKKQNKNKCFCSWIIFTIIAIVLSFFVGVLVAGLTTILSVLGIGVIIALIIAFIMLLVISIINIICCKKIERKKDFC